MDTMDKDQMLQEKDKQIEELTRMLRQKQRLVETLRSQLEQGKITGGIVLGKEGSEKTRTSTEVKIQNLIKASAIQPPTLPNGILVKVKKEVEPEEGMEGITEEAQAKKPVQPMQCSQETLLRLQQIHRLQVQQAEQQKQTLQQSQVQKADEAKSNAPKLPQQKKEAQILLHQQQQLQQLIIQQTQQKHLQAQQKLAQHKLAHQKTGQQKLVPQNQLKQTQGQVQQSQQKNQVQLKQVQIQKPAVNHTQQRKQLKAQQRQQTAAVTTQQVKILAAPHDETYLNVKIVFSPQPGKKIMISLFNVPKLSLKQTENLLIRSQVAPVIIGQQNGTQIHTQAISLDLLKANGTPTLVTDGNGNHYLITLPINAADGQNGVSSLAKTNGRITLQVRQN